MHHLSIAVAVGVVSTVALTQLALAADQEQPVSKAPLYKAPPPPPAPVYPWTGFYIGLGGSYNWTHFDQSLQGISGLISVFDAGVLTAQAQEGGPFLSSTDTNPISLRMFSSADALGATLGAWRLPRPEPISSSAKWAIRGRGQLGLKGQQGVLLVRSE